MNEEDILEPVEPELHELESELTVSQALDEEIDDADVPSALDD